MFCSEQTHEETNLKGRKMPLTQNGLIGLEGLPKDLMPSNLEPSNLEFFFKYLGT
jgi:hypothetical protein